MKITNVAQKFYETRTSDLALAAAIFLFLPLKSVDRNDPRRAIFIFEDTPQLQQLLTDFWNKQLKVEPRAYFESIKALKTRLYEPD